MNKRAAVQCLFVAMGVNVVFFVGMVAVALLAQYQLHIRSSMCASDIAFGEHPNFTDDYETVNRQIKEHRRVDGHIHHHFANLLQFITALAVGAGMLLGVVNVILIRAWVLLRRDEQRLPAG